ncbi:hypothetical protein LCGC14_1192630 [marine sediment metagenome]|uniref:Uncharacterized protein n=1 Tax=marine sediment metagenome TaxID=412755 RepID=A0A0F9P1L7_9ZZZZ
MTNQDRIQLAEAMKLEIYSRGADTYPLRKLHNNLMQPFTPLTDANDDVAILEWARTTDYCVCGHPIWELIDSELVRAGDEMLTDYKVGMIAKAASRALDRASEEPQRDEALNHLDYRSDTDKEL